MVALIIREANRSDCAEVCRLIQELADYEKIPDGPKIGVKQLEEDGFGNHVFYNCFVAEGRPSTSTNDATMTITTTTSNTDSATNTSSPPFLVAYAVYFYAYSWHGRVVYMEDLYVTPSHRSQGLGTRLWAHVVKTGLAHGCVQCKFTVLNWNAPSIAYYLRKGAIHTTSGTPGYHTFRLIKSAMEAFVENMISIPNITVRSPTEDEMSIINEFQKGVAVTMGSSSDVHLTTYMLQRDGYQKNPPLFRLLVAVTSSGVVLGFTMFYYVYSTWEGRSLYMEDIYVVPEHRKNGIGNLLWQTIVKDGLSLGCSRCDFATTPTNASAVAFYEKRGAVDITRRDGWLQMMLRQPAMEKLVQDVL